MGYRWLYMLFLSFTISFCLTPVFGWLATRLNILDRPGLRKIHSSATPMLGGAAVFFAFVVAILINGIYSLKLGVILVSSGLLFGVGILDDVNDIPAGVKLSAQIVCAAIVIGCGIVLKVVPDSFGMFSKVTNVLLTLFWIIGITNAMNFFDGMDGLAPGLGAIISLFLGLVAFQTQQPFLGWISVAMLGSCLGFLPYNFRRNGKALIFLGDAGSTVIGFVLASVAVYGDWAEASPVVALASPLLIFWVLIFDMVYITVDRILTRKVLSLRQWIEYVGKDHLHHRIAYALGGQKKSVLFIYLLSFCLGASALLIRNARLFDAVLLLLQASIFVVLITILERRGRTLAMENGLNDPP
ncbi:MAG: glycosyltransferase family 4 protein [Planctomycetota bacterium]|jgi:UDP-GlcNAc:undecaprenyl-phosphate GlcNAc-1-phosphate transferase